MQESEKAHQSSFSIMFGGSLQVYLNFLDINIHELKQPVIQHMFYLKKCWKDIIVQLRISSIYIEGRTKINFSIQPPKKEPTFKEISSTKYIDT